MQLQKMKVWELVYLHLEDSSFSKKERNSIQITLLLSAGKNVHGYKFVPRLHRALVPKSYIDKSTLFGGNREQE